MQLPPLILFINSDLDGYNLTTLSTQLYLDGYISKMEFDERVAVIPSYPDILHANGLRIMIILKDFRDYVNRELADVVAFYSHGLLNIEKNKYGPPNTQIPLENLTIYSLLRSVNSKYVITLPCFNSRPREWLPCDCFPHDQYHNCHCHKILGGIFAIESADMTGVHLPNCDRESNNWKFIHRK